MFIHQYDSLTGQYTNSVLATPDPRTDGWLIPAFSTPVPVPERQRGEWPFFINGGWVMRPDFRGLMLYRTDNGDAAEILIAGIGLEEAGLTAEPRPSDEYHWVNGAWEIDPAAVAARVRKEAMSEFDTRMNAAREKNWGKSDAHAMGMLTPLEAGLFRAWAAYQLELVRITQGPDFPNVREWPTEPDEAAVTAQVEAEQEAQRVADAERARIAAEQQAAIDAQAQSAQDALTASGGSGEASADEQPGA